MTAVDRLLEKLQTMSDPITLALVVILDASYFSDNSKNSVLLSEVYRDSNLSVKFPYLKESSKIPRERSYGEIFPSCS